MDDDKYRYIAHVDDANDEGYVERAPTSMLISIVATQFSHRAHLVDAAKAELDLRLPRRRA